jgi:hypothetical protein
MFYYIIDRKTNRVLKSFDLSWLSESELVKHSMIPNFGPQGMSEYTHDLIEKMEVELDQLEYAEGLRFLNLKKKLLDRIRECYRNEDLERVFSEYQEYRMNDRIKILRNYMQKLLSFQNFLMPYLMEPFIYKGQIGKENL